MLVEVYCSIVYTLQSGDPLEVRGKKSPLSHPTFGRVLEIYTMHEFNDARILRPTIAPIKSQCFEKFHETRLGPGEKK